MKTHIAILLATLIGLMTEVHAAGFTSIHAFGDSLSTTTDTPSPSADYYGGRYCNGRIWVEVLAGWQDLAYVPAQNNSSFGNDIEDVDGYLTTYTAPVDVATALYILWVSGADFANFMFAGSGVPYQASNIATWNTFVTNTLDSHEAVITALYDKGVRKFILPNQPDLSVAPTFGLNASQVSFIRARVQEFNTGLEARLDILLPTLPGLEVWTPDVFNLFDDIIADPSAYNLQSPIIPGPPPSFDYALTGAALPPDFEDGFGTDYIFWDDLNPTAAVQFILADFIQSEVCPPEIDSITPVPGGFELQFSNLQVGRPASIEGSGDLVGWFEDEAITPTSTTGTDTLNPTEPKRFFRLNFNSGWIWP